MKSLVITLLCAASTTFADNPIERSGVKGGIVVHLGAEDAGAIAALRANAAYQVQALDSDAGWVAKTRETLYGQGAYGPVSIDTFDGKALPYTDNFVNLLVAEKLEGVSMEEVNRVLVPNGVAMIGGKRSVKPKSPRLDDWTHFYYDAKGNAVSKDTEVGPPSRLQWVGTPRWSRHHDRMSSVSAKVSSNGRLFYIMDEGSRVSILLPSHWKLIARDAYNGTILWKKEIPKWSEHMWPLKSGPTQLARRLVGDGDRIFVTLGIGEPIVALDGATGDLLHTYPDTKGAEEILHEGGILYSLVNPSDWALKDFAPKLQQDQKRIQDEYEWDKKPRTLVAVDANSGKLLWKKEPAKVVPITLATDGRRIVYFDGDKVVCLDARTGNLRWETGSEKRRTLLEYNFGPRLLITRDTVLYAGGDGTQKGIDAGSGKEMWTGAHEKSGYRSPEDLIVAGGLVWNAGTTQGNQSGEFTGRDPRTGEVKKKFAPDVPEGTYWFHHRCYIAKATEQFIIPSRTGIEYVDIEKSHWDLNHWVRGACLYGVLPANGLTYAGPHNCACYPEAKLDGLNALSPGGSPHPEPRPDEQRLEKGPAYGAEISGRADPADWPTYRHDNARSGSSNQALSEDLGKAWEADLGGRLSAMTIANGVAFVAQVDAHTLHALHSEDGSRLWHFIAGGRIDSPPTIANGRVYFGCKDGWVYCLRATDGALVWRFQGAPSFRKHAAWEQIESVWPVHGSVLVENNAVSFVAGRSVFLDGGLRFIRLDAETGKKLVEVVYNDRDPETGGDFQDRHKTLQMPVGLNDILSSDGKVLYLRSQKILPDGNRIEIGPISHNAAEQGGAQKGEGRHLFAPMGFLDDSWFHRSYWVYGKNFAGGHNGYFQAGKYTPEGRILVHDDKNVYGYSRLPQYYKWTTTMEHQLFSASKEAPDVAVVSEPGGRRKNAQRGQKPARVAPSVKFDGDNLPIAGKALTIEAWILPDGGDGVIAQHGGGNMGYALALEGGAPGFSIRAQKTTTTAQSARPLDSGWHHVAGVVTADKLMRLYVDGQIAAETRAHALVPAQPRLGLSLGDAGSSRVSEYGKGTPYTGMIDHIAVWPRALEPADIIEHANGANYIARNNGALLACTFDNGTAKDDANGHLLGAISGVETGKGKFGAALWFRKTGGGQSMLAPAGGAPAAGGPAAPGPSKGSFVQHEWNAQSPVFARAMCMAKNVVFVSGPPDLIDEEYAFERMSQKDPAVHAELAEQDAALRGEKGGSLLAVNTGKGGIDGEVKLDSPPVWDGMAIAQGRLYVASEDGKVRCFGRK